MYPQGTLSLDAKGNLYGTTSEGGNGGSQGCCGVVFMLDSTGKETILHNFTGTNGDGATPLGGVVLDESGNLYGTTQYGGDLSNSGLYGCGTVYNLAP
jgi:uncharacterized repeat protein (TIGR03803 family)